MAKLVIGIVLIAEGQNAFTEDEYHQLEDIAYGPRLVQEDDKFMVVEFKKEKILGDGPIGNVLAKGIPDKESARNLASYSRLQDTLVLAASVIAPYTNDVATKFPLAFTNHVMSKIGDEVYNRLTSERAAQLFGKRMPRGKKEISNSEQS